MSLSSLLYLPLLLIAGILLYVIYGVGYTSYAYCLIPIIGLVAVIYTLSPQIDWWWWQKYPLQLDEPIKKWLEKSFAFYQQLSDLNKKRFEHRLALFLRGTEYIGQGVETVPEEIKAMSAINAVWVGFGQKDFLFPNHQRVIFYRGAFPSIQNPTFHASEVFTDERDGGLILSAPHLMESMNDMVNFYNIGLHEYAAAFQQTYPEKTMPAPPDELVWEKLSLVSGVNCHLLPAYMGTPTVDAARVGIVYFLAFPARFQAVFPEWYDALQHYLNLNPMNGANPNVVSV
jgi:Mlc titration factor MtfA (ptsG expression regulator)